jgi:hypothetical protein
LENRAIGTSGVFLCQSVWHISRNGTSIEEDLYNRDFTINAIAYRCIRKKLLTLRRPAGPERQTDSNGFWSSLYSRPGPFNASLSNGSVVGVQIEPATVSAIAITPISSSAQPENASESNFFKIFVLKNHTIISLKLSSSGLLFSLFPNLAV